MIWSRTASLAALPTGCGAPSPRSRSAMARARPAENSAAGALSGRGAGRRATRSCRAKARAMTSRPMKGAREETVTLVREKRRVTSIPFSNLTYKPFKELLLCHICSNQNHLSIGRQGTIGIGVGDRVAVVVEGDDGGACFGADIRLGQRFAGEAGRHLHGKGIQPFGKHQEMAVTEEVDTGIGAHGGVGGHEVGPGTV